LDEYDDDNAVVLALPVEAGAKAVAELKRANTEARANFMIDSVGVDDD
jgi:hypothetical protein